MKYTYPAIFTPIEDGSGFYAKVPDLPGCITTGRNLSDAINQITDAMSAWLVVAEDEHLKLAAPTPQCDLPLLSGESCAYIKADTLTYRAQTDTRSVREFVKRLVFAWDPDYTKLTPQECSRLKAAEQGEYISGKNINWDDE